MDKILDKVIEVLWVLSICFAAWMNIFVVHNTEKGIAWLLFGIFVTISFKK